LTHGLFLREAMDPLNVMNPGIGGTSTAKKWAF